MTEALRSRYAAILVLALLGFGSAARAQTPTPTATPQLVALTLGPATAKRTAGQTQNFTTIGTYSDGSTKNLTQAVTYASSDPSVAVCPNAAGNRGRVETVGPGIATISASDAATGITSTDSQGDAVLTVVAAGPSPTGPTPPQTTPTATPQVAHLADPAAAQAAERCQSTLAKYAGRFLVQRLDALGRCTSSISRCVHKWPDRPNCVARAGKKCAAVLSRSAAAEARLRSRLIEGCGPAGTTNLLAEAGLGYEALASRCSDEFAVAIPDTAGFTQCIVDQHDCRAKALLAVEEPRAGQLIALVDGSLAGDACLPILGGTDSDGQAGAQLLRCGLRIKRVARRMVARRLAALARCASAAFGCLQTEQGDERCYRRVRTRCDRAVARIDTDASALGPAIAKECGGIDFALLHSPAGAHLAGLAAECAARGVSDLATLGDYQLCLYRHHACIVEDILRFESPRVEEMLTLLGHDLKAAFCGP